MQKFIPLLLDMFYNTLLTGKHGTENGAGKALQKNSIAQDIIDSVSNGRLLTPKSVLFPAVVKSLCNNTEVLRILNELGHGICYDLVQEIETEHALDVINEQRANKVVIPEEDMINAADNAIAVMIADNIDNLESTITGFGTSHRVNSILVTKKVEDNAEESKITRPTKRKCLRPNVFAQNMHMKIGKGSKSRIIDINKVKAAIASKLHAQISCQEFCRSLIGMHAFTGCDSVSALAGKGKSRALKLLMANSDYIAAFSNLGNTWLVSADLLSKLEEFVCSLYGKRLQNVDLLCYQLYCSKGGKLNQKLYRHANQLLHYM